MSWNGFANLDLSGVEADTYAPLSPGEYSLRCTDVELNTGPNGMDKRLVVSLSDVNGAGSIKSNFNLVHKGSAKAQEIGLKQLKSFLLSGKHPNPDNPGDVNTLKGLIVRAYIGMGKPYIGKDGQERTSPEVKRYLLPDEVGGAAPTASQTVGGGAPARDLNDEIPF